MAEGGDLLSVSVQKLDEELTCPVCQDHFEEPKVLPCLHYYCKKCLSDLISRARGKPINCPECRREVRVADNDPESLPTAFFVNRMEEVYSVMKKAEPKENVKCENCLEHPSVAFCQNCGEYICEECMKAHKKLRQFASHVIVPLDSLRTSMTKNESVGLPVIPQELKCSKHKDEPLKLYCHTCFKLICRDCIVIDHSGHKYAFVVDVAPQCKSAIKEKATSLQNVSSSLKSALASLADSKKRLLDHSTATTKAIDDAHDKVASQLQQKRKELKEEATKRINASTEEINTQQKNAQLAMGEVESLVEFLNRNLEIATDQELLSLQKQMSDQADRMAQLYANPVARFPVPRLPQLDVQCNEDILQVLHNDFFVNDKANTQTLQWKGSVHKLTSQLEKAQQQAANSEAAWKEAMKQKEAAVAKLTSEKKNLEKEVAQLKIKNQELTELASVSPKPRGLVPSTTAVSTPGPRSQPPPEPHSPLPVSLVDQEMSNVFTNLNGDALALLERLPEGDIPGVRYNAKAGSVQIQLNEKSDVDDAILKFQDAYKRVALRSRDRRQLLVECVDVPVTRTKKEVQSQITRFEQQYKFCAFVFEEEKRRVKIISQSRQFEQAKQFFRDALQEPRAAGKQPPGGAMYRKILPYSVPGYEGCNTIQISYTIPSGVQGPEHPNPGQPYNGTSRIAYLPDNDEGREVFKLLQEAFIARLIFTVGTSVTTGAQNVVVWGDIHHKTNISGGQQGYGYPDPTYLQRVKKDLAAKGIVPSVVPPQLSKFEHDNIEMLSQSQEKFLREEARRLQLVFNMDRALKYIQLKGSKESIAEMKMKILEILSQVDKETIRKQQAATMMRVVQWKRMDSSETLYDPLTNLEIEEAYCAGKPNYVFSHPRSAESFTIDFTEMDEIDHTLNDQTCRVKRIVEGAEGESGLPDDWEPMTDPKSGKEVPLRVIDLPPGSKGYQFALTEFHKTMAAGSNYTAIVNIQRIQNPSLYGQYIAKKKYMDIHNPKGVQNERWLFHGVSSSAVPKINQTNFNRSFRGQNGTVYGKGCYFARDASYSNRYASPDAQGLKCMYVVRVLTGEYIRGDTSMFVPPPKDPNDPTVLFDSVVDSMSNPSIYVVFYDADVYPEYLIVYK